MTKVAINSGRGNGTGAGRTKGTPNKSTAQAREAVALLVEGNLPKLQGWLDRIAADDPKAALDSMVKLLEYHVPKLARTELDGHLEETCFSIQSVATKTDEEILMRMRNRIMAEIREEDKHRIL